MSVACMMALLASACLVGGEGREDRRPDPHSFSRPDQVRVTRLELGLNVELPVEEAGRGGVLVDRAGGDGAADAPLILDTRDLTIGKVEVVENVNADGAGMPVRFELGRRDPILGQALTIFVPPGARRVRIEYATAPHASALQWVDLSGTFGKKHPFLYTQSQAIHARSWVPCQDTPGVRFTYKASVGTTSEVMSLMSADLLGSFVDGVIRTTIFAQEESIPSYLLALAVGRLDKREISPRAAVWAEPEIVEKAAWEFADTEMMIEAAEKRFGPYRWRRYDILVLPPSFPYGGMENPKLTFATPTVLAGDRSQVALIAHELAHSWSGNLVTNATWSDFWLNEGFTTYLQNRIVEEVYGKARAEMENVLGHGELLDELKQQAPRDQILKVDLDGRDPDEAVTRIPYEKGAAFLKALEAKVGREKLDAFLRDYFAHFAFRSITTAEFETYLSEHLFAGGGSPLDLWTWIHAPGLPADAVVPRSARLDEVEAVAGRWLAGELEARVIDAAGWTTLEWLQFLRALPRDLGARRMAELDDAFHLTRTGNAEVACQWFEMAIRAGYARADEALAEYLKTVGRRKLIVPLYAALAAAPRGRDRARAMFAEARAGYHPIAVDTIEKLLGTGG